MEYLFGLAAMVMVMVALAPQVVDMCKVLARRPRIVTVEPMVPVIHRHDQDDLDHPWFR